MASVKCCRLAEGTQTRLEPQLIVSTFDDLGSENLGPHPGSPFYNVQKGFPYFMVVVGKHFTFLLIVVEWVNPHLTAKTEIFVCSPYVDQDFDTLQVASLRTADQSASEIPDRC